MNRLTEKQSAGYDLKAMNGDYCEAYCRQQNYNSCRECGIYEAITKLAEYEDLEEQMIAKTGVGLSSLMRKYFDFLDDMVELANYRQLEEQGLLLRLPCKIKDSVYQIIKPNDATDYTIRKGNVDRIDMQWGWGNKVPRVSIMVKFGRNNYTSFSDKNVGSHLFLTREEAEARLKELESE